MDVSQMLSQMTLEEKCALLSGKDVWHTRAVERAGIPSISLSDGPSGLRKQEGEGDHLGLNASVKATCFPSAAALANSWNPELTERVGAAIAKEAKAQDVQVLLGPGLNTKRSPLCGRNFEYYSEDPYLSGKLAAGFIRGAQREGVSACPKHFAANSQEGHRMASDSVMDERTLRELYLTNFEIAVREGCPKCLMSAYNRVNGVYANENEHLLGDILRREWGFDGAVVTDWGGGNDFVEGTRAGSSLEMPGAGDDSACQLIRAVREGRIDEATVDKRAGELLRLIVSTHDARQPGSFDAQRHHEIAHTAAREAIVLLKNEGNLLPLARECRVAVIGDFARTPRYQGAGSSMVNPTQIESTLDLLQTTFPASVGFAPGFLRADKPDAALSDEAVSLAKTADVVLLYLGLTEVFETEGLDRTHMRIPQNQIDLLSRLSDVNPRIVVVLSAGSAVEMPWLDRCQALVYGCLGGQAGARAMLEALSGAICPSGKLAETFPLAYTDMPVSRYYPGAQRTSEYREGLYVGYRYFVTADAPVLFPFGFGLSYTSFAYSDIEADEARVSFTLTNTGSRPGSEIAEVYVGLPGAKVFRPRYELKGFAKVALAPGESKRVTVALDDKAFRYFNVKTGRFEIEGGDYRIMVGASACDIRLSAAVAVKGTDAPNPYEGGEFACYREAKLDAVPDSSFAALLGRPIPPHNWDETAPLQMNDALMQLYYAKNPIARFVGRRLERMQAQSIQKGAPDLNLLFIYNIPFRGIAKMMNGMVSMEMAEAILRMANGHFFSGLGRLISGFLSRPNLPKENKGKETL
ncbi:MAG: glycoside hydrolase family 3 C-terminal domain-containing protein [Clostridia bacterium]|nr:glycoside hydrolase family 3 C-terminal domain-containing protein [Clostridia bacterium]